MSVLAMDRVGSCDGSQENTSGTLAYIAYVVSQVRSILARSDVFTSKEVDHISLSVREVLYECGELDAVRLAESLKNKGFSNNFSLELAKALTTT